MPKDILCLFGVRLPDKPYSRYGFMFYRDLVLQDIYIKDTIPAEALEAYFTDVISKLGTYKSITGWFPIDFDAWLKSPEDWKKVKYPITQ